MKGRTAALTIALLLGVMLAMTLGLRMAKRGELLAQRVVVGASGCSVECNTLLARALAGRLREVGFDAVAPEAPLEALSTPERVRGFARERGARSAVMVALAVHDTALEGGGVRVNADSAIYVMDAARQAAPHPQLVLHTVQDADRRDAALALVARHALRGLFPVAAEALLTTHAVAALKADASGLEQQAAALALSKHERALAARSAAAREYAMQCQTNARALAASDLGRCISGGCAREYVAGVLPDASALIVHDAGDVAFFPFAPDSAPRRLGSSERLWRVARDGARTLLAEAARFEAAPDLARDGSVLAFVEQSAHRSAVHALSLATRTRRLIAAAVAPEHVTTPRVSPDGTRVLYFHSDGRRARSALRVADTTAPTHARTLLADALDARWLELSAAPGRPRQPWVAALVGDGDGGGDGDGEPAALVLIDAESGRIAARELLGEHAVRAIGDAAGDDVVLAFEGATCGFGRVRFGRGAQWYTTALCPEQIAAGRSGVFAHVRIGDAPEPRRLVRLDLARGELALLARPAADARAPHAALAADTLAYERVFPRRYGELQHIAVCLRDEPQRRERAGGTRNPAAPSSASSVSAVCRSSGGRNSACH